MLLPGQIEFLGDLRVRLSTPDEIGAGQKFSRVAIGIGVDPANASWKPRAELRDLGFRNTRSHQAEFSAGGKERNTTVAAACEDLRANQE